MSYTRFSTDRADYHLEHGIHIKTTDFEGIENIDALVLEKLDMNWHNTNSLKKPSKQYKSIIKKAEDSRIPIYMADADTNIGYTISSTIAKTAIVMSPFYLEAFSSSIGSDNIGLPLTISVGIASAYLIPTITTALSGLYLGLKRGEIKDSKAEKIISKTSRLLPSPVILGRNIITAEKVEEFIVPNIKNKIGRKPNVGVVYGAEHAGIRKNLENAPQRKKLLNLYSKLNYFGIRKGTINDVLEFRYNGKDWNLEEFDTKLFK